MYKCPKCNISLIKGDRQHFCKQCGFSVPYTFRGHHLSDKEIESLLTIGTTGIHCHWLTKDGGRKICGALKLKDDFSLSFFAQKISYRKCPSCKSGDLYYFSHGIFCPSCNYALFRKIASRELQNSEIMHLLVYGETEVLDRFVNSENGKYFSARLSLDEFGNVTFKGKK